jgi:hypothetical protein
VNLKNINWQLCILEKFLAKVTVFWEVMPYSQIIASVPEEHTASMFTVEE